MDYKARETKLMTITPDMAKEWLENNFENNRKVNERWVNSLSRDMLSGHWGITNESIGFAEDGTLVDGQHRLRAILKANIPVNINVTTGIKMDAIRYIDCGKSRTLSDRMRVNGDDQLYTSVYIHALIRAIHEMLLHDQTKKIYTMDEMEYEITKYKYICKFYMAVRNFAIGISSVSVACAMIAALGNGIGTDAIRNFVRCIGKNEIEGTRYRWKSALDFANYYQNTNIKVRASRFDILTKCMNAIDTFVNDKKRSQREYEVNERLLNQVNEQLRGFRL